MMPVSSTQISTLFLKIKFSESELISGDSIHKIWQPYVNLMCLTHFTYIYDALFIWLQTLFVAWKCKFRRPRCNGFVQVLIILVTIHFCQFISLSQIFYEILVLLHSWCTINPGSSTCVQVTFPWKYSGAIFFSPSRIFCFLRSLKTLVENVQIKFIKSIDCSCRYRSASC